MGMHQSTAATRKQNFTKPNVHVFAIVTGSDVTAVDRKAVTSLSSPPFMLLCRVANLVRILAVAVVVLNFVTADGVVLVVVATDGKREVSDLFDLRLEEGTISSSTTTVCKIFLIKYSYLGWAGDGEWDDDCQLMCVIFEMLFRDGMVTADDAHIFFGWHQLTYSIPAYRPF